MPPEVGTAGMVALTTIDKDWLLLVEPEEGQPTVYFAEELPLVMVQAELV